MARSAGGQMNNETNRSWTSMALVIGLCAAIGFGAVYAIVGGGDNRAEPSGSQKAQAPKVGLKNDAPSTAAQASSATAVGQDLKTSDGKPLNRGEMTTFVFKKQPMPVANPPTFNGPDGKAMMLSDLKGKVVLLNLWATWCAPCRKEMPFLAKLQTELGSDQFEVVALSVDRGGPDKAKKFLAEVGASALKFYHDPTAQAGFSLMAIGMPTTLLFDREGREIGRLVGPAEWHSDDAKALIKAAIAAD
jgi:thiol-disulfide isomerase/thioredoxin